MLRMVVTSVGSTSLAVVPKDCRVFPGIPAENKPLIQQLVVDLAVALGAHGCPPHHYPASFTYDWPDATLGRFHLTFSLSHGPEFLCPAMQCWIDEDGVFDAWTKLINSAGCEDPNVTCNHCGSTYPVSRVTSDGYAYGHLILHIRQYAYFPEPDTSVIEPFLKELEALVGTPMTYHWYKG